MKKYILEAIVEGERIRFEKEFNSRREALDYFFDYYYKCDAEDFRINEEYYINDNKHNIEYVCDYNNRFRICRV